jgi:hypothetical protein
MSLLVLPAANYSDIAMDLLLFKHIQKHMATLVFAALLYLLK